MHPIGWLLAGIITAEAYTRYVSPERKVSWENSVKMHHGEAGIIGIVAGLATKSPALSALGLGLTLHDWSDRNKWFKERS